jgi:MtaA/CmuA family methyltransferase
MSYSPIERFHDALKGKPRDHVPLFPMIAGWAAANFSDVPPSRLASDAGLIVQAQIRAREAAGYDPFFAYANALHVPGAFGCNVRFPGTGPISDPLPFTFSTVEDVEKMLVPDSRNNPALSLILEVVEGLTSYGKGEIPVLGAFEGAFTTACRLFDADVVLRLVLKKRPILEALLDKINGFLLGFGKALVEKGANALFIPEPTASASMISPRVFRELVLPRLRGLLRELEVPCILHICGDTTITLDAMAETGFHVLSLDQCMDLGQARSRLPGVVLGGNVDPIKSLLMGSRQQVVDDTLNCLRSVGTGKYVLMTGCGVPPHASLENVKAMIETAVEYGLGPGNGF